MTVWKKVKDQADIDELLEVYGGFHDSSIVSLSFKSGNYITDDCNMRYGDPEHCKIQMVFQSLWKPKSIGLCFTGVRRIHLAGLQDNYTSEICDAFIGFCDNILPSGLRNSGKVIVWADSARFDIRRIENGLNEPADTYIIADSLKWRIIED